MLERLLPLCWAAVWWWNGNVCGLGSALLSCQQLALRPLTPSEDNTVAGEAAGRSGSTSTTWPSSGTSTVDPVQQASSAIPSFSSSSPSSSSCLWSTSDVTVAAVADALLCGLLPCLILAVMLCLFLLERRWDMERRARKQRHQRSVRESSEQDQGEGDHGRPTGDGDGWVGRRVGDYVLGRLIAKGLYGHVREGRHVVTGAKVAVKVVERSRVPGPRYEETELMRRTKHRNIVGLLDVEETKDATFLVLEYLGGGELFHYMQDKRCLSEDEARRYWRQIVCAVAYLHCSGIAHRDLKLENVMFAAAPGGRKVKVIDLGLSSSISPGRLLRSYCGSVEYAAPEVLLRQPHDGRSSDVWALGVMLYALVVGFRPFLDCKAAVQGKYASLDEVARAPDGVDTTPEFRDLLQRIFQTDPRQRISIHGVMAHPWTGF